MNVLEEAFDVHGGPGERADTGSETSLEVVNVRSQQTASVRTDLVHDSDALSYNILELIVVVLELGLLEEDELGTFGDLDSNTCKALGFTDESEDLSVEVDVELQVLVVSDEQSGLEAGFCAVDFLLPFFSPHVLIGEEGVTQRVVVSHVLSGVGVLSLQDFLGELFHRHRYAVEQVARPGDGTSDGRQVTYNWWLLLVSLVIVLDLLDL